MIQNRNKTLDVAKGISILLMTLSHLKFLTRHKEISSLNVEYLMIFKMPLFIIISGFLISENKTLREFFQTKLDGLLKPMLTIFGTIFLISSIYHMRDGVYTFNDIWLTSKLAFHKYFLPLWFIFTLFVALIVFRLMMYVNTKFNKITFVVISVLTIGALLYLNHYSNKWIIFTLAPVIYFVVYLGIGFAIKKLKLVDTLINPKSFIIAGIVYTIYAIFKEEYAIKIALWGNIYGPFILTLISSFAGVILVLNISRYLTRFTGLSEVLFRCSKNSFYILAFHIIIGNYILYPIYIKYIEPNIIVDIVAVLLIISSCIVLRKSTLKTRFIKYSMLPLKSLK